nr:hypothetical protein [Burkholderia cepacia]
MRNSPFPFNVICRLEPTAAKLAWLLDAPIAIWHAAPDVCHVPLGSVSAVQEESTPSLKYATSFANAAIGIDDNATTPASADSLKSATRDPGASTQRAPAVHSDLLPLLVAEQCSLTTTHAPRTRLNTTRKIRFITTTPVLPPYPVSGARRRSINVQRIEFPSNPAM